MDQLIARKLGLIVELHTSTRPGAKRPGRAGHLDTPFWMVRDLATGRDLGSFVPATGSARVGRVMYAGVDEAAALVLYAELVAQKGVGR